MEADKRVGKKRRHKKQNKKKTKSDHRFKKKKKKLVPSDRRKVGSSWGKRERNKRRVTQLTPHILVDISEW